ncbi:MAG TPA: hypothetical protein VG649_02920 [Candidatus Angelobacter sp.]|nr:hypothetical protein [Candidatus Angelobacter sp.]
MTPDLLARCLDEFLSESHSGVVSEEGQIIFDLGSARYSVSSDHGKCLLHIWSEERNIVRQVLDSELKNGILRLSVRKFAQARPHQLEIRRSREYRTPTARKTARNHYARQLQQIVERELAGWTADRFSTSMDLERSFSPVYARGLVRKGQNSLAILGVNPQESQASVDAALTFGLLWLESCREREAGRSLVEGLRLYVPPKRSSTLQVRMAQLNQRAANFRLFEVDEHEEAIVEKPLTDLANLDSHLAHCPDTTQAHSRFQLAIAKIMKLMPEAEVAVLSPVEISFRLYGLEFARARLVNEARSFNVEEEIVFGVSGAQQVLEPEQEAAFSAFIRQLIETRSSRGDKRDPIYRAYPERWLESLALKNITGLDSQLNSYLAYSQVPAFSASDRSMIDVLTCTREGRLAVLELKADEDIHLPMQGLDYWARVLWHQQRQEFQKYGYFPGISMSQQSPLLFLVAPSLRVHPAVDTILKYFSPAIEWTLICLDERWREGIRVVYRKSSAQKTL